MTETPEGGWIGHQERWEGKKVFRRPLSRTGAVGDWYEVVGVVAVLCDGSQHPRRRIHAGLVTVDEARISEALQRRHDALRRALGVGDRGLEITSMEHHRFTCNRCGNNVVVGNDNIERVRAALRSRGEPAVTMTDLRAILGDR